MTTLLTLITLLLSASGAWAKDAPENVLASLGKAEDRIVELELSMQPAEARMCDDVLLKSATYVNHAHELAALYGELFGQALHMYNVLSAYDRDREDPLHGEGRDMLDSAMERIQTIATEWPHKARFLEELLRRNGPTVNALEFARLNRQQGMGSLFATLFGVGAVTSLYGLQNPGVPWWASVALAGTSMSAAVYSVFHFDQRFPLKGDALDRNAESHFFRGARRGGVELPGGAINSPRWVADTWDRISRENCEGGLQ